MKFLIASVFIIYLLYKEKPIYAVIAANVLLLLYMVLNYVVPIL